LLVGALSDALRPLFAEDSLRFALVAGCPGYAWGALHMWFASKRVTGDLQAVQLQEARDSAPREEIDGAQSVGELMPSARERGAGA
jgi:hypothetical protein